MCANYIYGTGGLAREIFGWMRYENCSFLQDFQGFIDREPYDQVFGQPVWLASQVLPEANVIIAVGCGEARKRVFQEMKVNGFKIKSYISRDCSTGQNISIGEGTIICPHSSISSDVTIGDGCLINCHSGIGHDSIVGDFCTLLGFCAVNGSCHLSDNVTVGSGSVLHPKVRVGMGATVGIGAVVLKNVRQETVVFGNPAKILK